MSRDATPYAERRPYVVPEGYGFNADKPIAGYYKTRLRSGAVPAGIRIWFGPPHDPDTGEEMDRGHRWQAHANGKYINLERVWPGCAREQINAAEYEYLCRLQEWGVENAPDGPQADPFRKVDLLKAPLTL